MGANIGTAQAVIADVTPQGDRARGMGLVGMAFGLGFVFGPAIGGFAVKVSPALPGLVAAGLSLVAFVWAFFGLPETRPASAAARPRRHAIPFRAVLQAIRRPVIGPLLVITLLNTTAFANFEATFAQFARSRFGHDPSTVSWLFVLIGVTAAIVQGGLIRRLVPLLGEARLVGIGTTLLALSFAGLVLVPGNAALVVLVVTTAAGSGLTNPALAGLLSRSTDAAEQGELLGAAQSLSSLGRIIGPFWGEHAWFAWGAAGPYGTGALLEVAAVVVVLVGLRAVAAPERRPS
jgi:predicted MFS family arabinose efflux permease